MGTVGSLTRTWLSRLSPLCFSSERVFIMMRTATIMIMVMSTSLVSGDGKYWWMGSGGAFSDGSSNGNNNYQQQHQQQPKNNYQGSGSQNVGITQGIQSQVSGGGGSCPAVTSVPPVSQCSGRVSDCWSVGQPDVDCLNNALCCFDGCANVCQGAGSRSPAPPPNPRPAQAVPVSKPTRQQNQQPAKKVQQKPKVHKQRPKVNKMKTNPWPNKSQQQPRPQQQPARRPQVNNNNNNNNRPYTGPQAESKPFVRCPSAMKCVPKVNCNLEGVMVNEILNYSPAVEMLRVPLIPCVNMAAGNVVDVCCSDPNYKDPWPNMMNNGGNNNNGNNGGYVDNNINARNGKNIIRR